MSQKQLSLHRPVQDVAKRKDMSTQPLDIISMGPPTTLAHRAGIPEVLPRATAARANATETVDEDMQAEKSDTLKKLKKAVSEGVQDLTANDIKAIGAFIMSLSPQGRAELLTAPFGRGALLSQTRGRNASTIDTFEHYAVVREVKRLQQEYLKTKLDNENAATEVDRLLWSVRKTDEAVALQTMPLAR
jgi:hypothetical protein